jgi:hypothetical protein
VWKLMVAVLLGFVLLAIFMLSGKLPLPELELPSGAAWLLPWLAGLTLVSWLGKFPEPYAGNRGVLSFEWSIGAIVVLSAIVYGLAHRFQLSPEDAQAHMRQVEREAEVVEEPLAAGH